MIRIKKSEMALLQEGLLAWFVTQRRKMPWRETRNPYAIWTSEIMLQQTQVATVIPYFQRWMARFPTVTALAAADQVEVLKLWEGLGYYSRARNLHKAAQLVVEQFDGIMPDTVTGLRALPGIGAYTAGAVASIAFGLDEPVVDGNVIRVLCRFFRIQGMARDKEVQAELWRIARALIPSGQAGDFNQALMELGALACRPASPRCGVCPVAPGCRALKRGDVDAFPAKALTQQTPHYEVVAAVIQRKQDGTDEFLIDRRKPDGLLGGLWEFPGGKVEPGETHGAALRRELQEELAISIEPGELICTVKHAYTHFKITLHVYECRHTGGTPAAIACDDVRWVPRHELGQYPFPKANHRIISRLCPEDA